MRARRRVAGAGSGGRNQSRDSRQELHGRHHDVRRAVASRLAEQVRDAAVGQAREALLAEGRAGAVGVALGVEARPGSASEDAATKPCQSNRPSSRAKNRTRHAWSSAHAAWSILARSFTGPPRGAPLDATV